MMKFSGDSGTILLIDDEQENIHTVGTILSSFGYDLLTASSGEQAMERIATKLPDLVLLDILMPGMSGFEVCRVFRSTLGIDTVPVIFLSANNDKNTIVQALECGGVDYVTKPFNKAELLARVRSHLALKKYREESQRLLHKTERFLEIMAHDLRNWVGCAHFTAQVLDRVDEIPGSGKRLSRVITESTGQALTFIDQFLEETRGTHAPITLERKTFDLRAAVESSIRMHQEEARKKEIILTLIAEQNVVKIKSDRNGISRIIENLLTNSIKFSSTHSQITFLIQKDVNSGGTMLIVRDEGPGFLPEDRKKLFEPYTRLSARPTQGEASTGLGLSVVKRLCEQLEIEITVEYPDKGASIRLSFLD